MTDERDMGELEDRLEAAWEQTETVEIPTTWQGDVMSRVRAAGAPLPAQAARLPFELAIRVGAIAASLVALASVAAAVAAGMDLTQEFVWIAELDPQAVLELVLLF